VKRTLIISAVLVVLILGGALIAPGFLDWNKYKPQILAQLRETTGHIYNIDGALDLAVLPYPHISIDGLSVSQPENASGGTQLLSLEKASVQLALMPLFKGEIVVNRVLLQKPVFDLAIDAKGVPSWTTPELQQKKQAGENERATGFGNAIALNEISIKEGRFTFTDFGAGKKVILTDINATLQGDSFFGPYSLNGTAVYNTHKIKVKLNSGRIDKLAESISAQVELGLPDLASSLTYSGVVTLDDSTLELQGEAGIETADIATLAGVFHKDAALPVLKKPLSARGVLTLNKDELAYRNTKLSFGDAGGNGYVVLKNFAKADKTPLDINLVFETDKTFMLDGFISPAAKKNAGTKTLLPETITLPREITGAINIKASVIQYKGMDYKDIVIGINSKSKGFSGQMTMIAPGGTVLDVNSALNFGTQSISSKNNAVTFSEPVLVLETKITSTEPLSALRSFLKQPPSPEITKFLAHNLVSEATLSVKPQHVEILDSFFKLGETRVNVKGRMTPNAIDNRSLLKLSVTNYGLNADKWITEISGSKNAATPVSPTKFDIAAFAKNMNLPFDIDLTTEIQNLHFQNRDYSRFAAKGKLVQSRLDLDTFQLTSNAGDQFILSGAIRDINNLQGVDLSFQANIIDPEQTLTSFGMKTANLPKNMGKTDVLAEFKGNPEKLSFTTNLKAMHATMEAAGELTDVTKALKVSDLTLRLKHPNYVELARIFNPKFNSGVAIKKNLDVFASMSRKGNIYSFSQLQATIGPSNIKGDVMADVSGTKPAVTAALVISDLPVDALLGIGKSTGVAGKGTSGNTGQDTRWSRNAINTAFLQKINLSLKATAASATYGNWNFKDTGINFDLKDGTLDIKQMDGGLHGGHVALTGNLKSSGKERQPISFTGNILAQDVNLEEFVKSFSGSRLVKARGTVSLETALQTTGLSPAALVFDLKGKGTANGSDIIFEGFDLAKLSRVLAQPTSSFSENFGRVLDGAMRGGSTRFEKLDGTYTISEGVIHFDKMDLSGQDADVMTRGTVSLPLWSLDLESTIQLHEPKDAPPLRASFKGPLDRPAQTFGQNAMQQYFQKQIEGIVVSPLLDKLDKSGALKNMMGLDGNQEQQQQKAPAPVAPPEESQPESSQQETPAPEQPIPPKEVRPEDAFLGILQNMIQGQ